MINAARNLLIMSANLLQMLFKAASNEAISKTAEATGDSTGNKIANKTTKIWKFLLWNKWEKVTHEEENIGFASVIPTERYIYPEKGQKVLTIQD